MPIMGVEMNTAKRILDDITEFIFIEDEPARADIIFIPGCAWPRLAKRAAELYHAGYAPFVLPAGRFSYKRDRFDGPKTKQNVYDGQYGTEWEFLRDVLMKNGVPDQAILREDQSMHTVDNAFFSKRAVEERGLEVRSAILCCKAYHARRCLMTYGWAFPGVEFIVCSTETQGVNRQNWHATAYGRQTVLGEVSKCGGYLKDLVEMISKDL